MIASLSLGCLVLQAHRGDKDDETFTVPSQYHVEICAETESSYMPHHHHVEKSLVSRWKSSTLTRRVPYRHPCGWRNRCRPQYQERAIILLPLEEDQAVFAAELSQMIDVVSTNGLRGVCSCDKGGQTWIQPSGRSKLERSDKTAA